MSINFPRIHEFDQDVLDALMKQFAAIDDAYERTLENVTKKSEDSSVEGPRDYAAGEPKLIYQRHKMQLKKHLMLELQKAYGNLQETYRNTVGGGDREFETECDQKIEILFRSRFSSSKRTRNLPRPVEIDKQNNKKLNEIFGRFCTQIKAIVDEYAGRTTSLSSRILQWCYLQDSSSKKWYAALNFDFFVRATREEIKKKISDLTEEMTFLTKSDKKQFIGNVIDFSDACFDQLFDEKMAYLKALKKVYQIGAQIYREAIFQILGCGHRDQLRDAKNRLYNLQEQLDQAMEEREALMRRIEQLNKRKKTLQEELNQLKSSKSEDTPESLKRIEVLNERLNALSIELSQSKAEATAAQASVEQLGREKADQEVLIGKLNGEIVGLKNEKGEIAGQLSEEQNKNEGLSKQLANAKRDLTNLQIEFDKVVAARDELQRIVNDLTEKRDALQEELSRLKASKSKDSSSSQERIKELEEQLKSLNIELDRSKAKAAAAQASVEQLGREKADQEVLVGQLKDEIVGLNDEKKHLTVQLNEEQEKNKLLRERLMKAEEDLVDYQDKLKQATAKRDELDQIKAKLKSKKQSMKIKLFELKSEKSSAFQKNIEELNEQLRSLDAKLSQSRAEAAAAQAAEAHLQGKVDELNEQIVVLKSDLAKERNDNRLLREELAYLKQSLAGLDEELAQVKEELTVAKFDLERAGQKERELDLKIEQLQKEKESIQKKLDLLEETQSKEKEALQKKLEDKDRKLDSLKVELEASRSQVEDARSSIDGLAEERGRLLNERDSLRIQLQALQAEVEVSRKQELKEDKSASFDKEKESDEKTPLDKPSPEEFWRDVINLRETLVKSHGGMKEAVAKLDSSKVNLRRIWVLIQVVLRYVDLDVERQIHANEFVLGQIERFRGVHKESSALETNGELLQANLRSLGERLKLPGEKEEQASFEKNNLVLIINLVALAEYKIEQCLIQVEQDRRLQALRSSQSADKKEAEDAILEIKNKLLELKGRVESSDEEKNLQFLTDLRNILELLNNQEKILKQIISKAHASTLSRLEKQVREEIAVLDAHYLDAFSNEILKSRDKSEEVEWKLIDPAMRVAVEKFNAAAANKGWPAFTFETEYKEMKIFERFFNNCMAKEIAHLHSLASLQAKRKGLVMKEYEEKKGLADLAKVVKEDEKGEHFEKAQELNELLFDEIMQRAKREYANYRQSSFIFEETFRWIVRRID